MSKKDSEKLAIALADVLMRDNTSPPGTTVWVPCAGRERLEIAAGHVGDIRVAMDTVDGETSWRSTGRYLSRYMAVQEFGKSIVISKSHGSCPRCAVDINMRYAPR